MRGDRYALIVQAVNKILSEYTFALTIRQIYYRLVAAGMIPNKRSAYNQLSKTLVKARENGEVDDTRIEDRARGVLKTENTYRSPETFVATIRNWIKNQIAELYFRDLWSDQGHHVEVWVEKDALSRVIQQSAAPLRVTVCPSRGYSSYTYIKRMAVEERFMEWDPNQPIIILDFRDHDPSGLQMTEDLEKRFGKYGGGLDIEIKRIALTIDQVKEYDLIPNPTKMADPRSPGYVAQFGNECWELDAIEPNELQRIVREAVEEHIDMDAWNESLDKETTEKNLLREQFKKARLSL
jgi:hypothetical protein